MAVATVLQFATERVNERLQGADPSVALERFVNYPRGAGKDKFELNPKFWAKGIDFSCVSPWNSAGGSTRAGTLISKRHIIYAKHFPMGKGTRILFVGEDGGVCPCYVEATKIAASDIMIGLLNADVTPNIHPAKILPPDFGKYIGDGKGMPVGTFNQREKLLLTVAYTFPKEDAPYLGIASRAPSDERWGRFREKIIKGDSGDPAFLLIGNDAVLIYCLSGGGFGSGPGIHVFRKQIQATMDELCPGYKLEEFDFEKVRCDEGK